MKCHRGFVSEAWAFLIENTILLENPCKKEPSHRFHEDSLIFSQPDKMDHAIQKSFSSSFFKYGETCKAVCLIVKLGVWLVNFFLVINGSIMRSSLVLRGRPNPLTGFLIGPLHALDAFPWATLVAEEGVSSLLADGKTSEGSVDPIWAGVRNGREAKTAYMRMVFPWCCNLYFNMFLCLVFRVA